MTMTCFKNDTISTNCILYSITDCVICGTIYTKCDARIRISTVINYYDGGTQQIIHSVITEQSSG